MRVLAAAAAGLILSACGGSSPSGPDPGPGTLTITITRQNGAQSFSPNPASAGGQTVGFRNADSIVHRVSLNDGTVSPGEIAPGATSAPAQMPAEGTDDQCTLHPDMIGARRGRA